MLTLFARWNSTDTRKAVDAVNRISKPSKLIAIALRARTMAARIAAVDKLDDEGLIKLAGVCGDVLKSNAMSYEKDNSAELLLFIYNSTPNHELRKKIQIADVALYATTIATRIAAVDKLDDEELTKVIGVCGDVLKSNAMSHEKNNSAELLLFIYNSTPNHELRKKIQIADVVLHVKELSTRIAAVDKLDDEELTKVISVCGDVLKSYAVEYEKDNSAELLLFIYNSTRSSEIREKIQALSGTVIRYGTEHNDYGSHSDYVEELECGNCPCPYTDHKDYYDNHTDSPGREAKRFLIP
ncbi:MAG: hypothetical protein LBD21_04080 [Tannerellaceae bacterium]|jgi:methyl coenzyme M reductase subunit D|nr:hypothetical protein [Tannerellaceae bacterium]